MTDKFDELELEAFQGNGETYSFSVMASETEGFDLSSYAVRALGRRSLKDPDVLWDSASTTGCSIVSTDFAVGKVLLKLPKAVTELLPPRSRYELTAQLTGEDPITLASGPVVLKRGLGIK